MQALKRAAAQEPLRPAFAGWLSETNDITARFLAAGGVPGLINLAGGLPEPATFPTEAVAALATEAARASGETLAYGPIHGLPALRDAIAARYSTPEMALSRDNVLITTAGMQGLSLVGQVLLEPGQEIACQSPAYLGALDAWRPRRPSWRPIYPESNGFNAAEALSGAQFGYVVPNFSNPTGRLVGFERRRALAEAAEATGTWLVEDDPYGALYYDHEPLPRILSLSGALRPGPYRGPVVYLGTVSKEVAPGLRIGWAVAAPEMIEALAMAKQGADMCTSPLTQRIVLGALETGLPEAMRPGILALYRRRRDALAAAMAAHLADLFDWEVPVGGMFIWATAKRPDFDTDRLFEAGLAAGVCVTPGRVFDPMGVDRRSIRLNFTLNDEAKLEEGVRRLSKAARSL